MSDLLSLPAELIETILIDCNIEGHPFSLAALGQVCRQLRTHIYDAPDHHLWRALFLTTFDDPRLFRGVNEDVDWQHAFTERTWAANFLQRRAQPLPVSPKKRTLRSTTSIMYPIDSFPAAQDSDPENHIRLLRALLSVISTARHSLRHQLLSQSTNSSDLTQAHARTSVYPPSVQDQTPSLNIACLRQRLSHGLPFTLIQHIFSWNVAGCGYNTPESQSFCQLTACLGFLPIPVVDAETIDASPPAHSSQRRAGKSRTDPREDENIEVQDMSETAQRARAREHARPRAFRMQYLSKRRNWGPYLAILPRTPNESGGGVDIPDAAVEDFDADSDADYVPPDDASMSTSSATPEPTVGPGPSPSTGTLPTTEQLRPDWAWLAAARIVAECKLRKHVDPEDIAKLEDWDNLRAGAWVPEPPRPSLDHTSKDSAQVQEPEGPVEGWRNHEHDWAGAEGIWRRLVCWLDYDDLMYHTNYGDFQDPELDEAWIIVPMSLRITGYSAPSLLQLFPDRPTIHVVGEMGGGGWVGSFDGADEDVRRVHGTVSMLSDGNVRWSTTSTAPGSNEDEWASESVQLGGVGSAIGALGMWTGAFHEDADPLGVIWQWRVG
ncbi:hypothetical protein LXA43DRAFT_926453 [Ganoderma leucocontextum]|nr:hypothetical protein LXA43DRAFT_926453 [Ganoderma leucocontextum]